MKTLRVLLVTLVMATGVIVPSVDATAAPPRPNLLTIMLDDANHDYNGVRPLDVMPRTAAFLATGARTFSDMYANTSSCCQSRSEFFSGRYMHNNGVNSQGKGNLLDPRTTIQTQLKNAGYHTFIQGKYLNFVQKAPGFDDASLILTKRNYRDYTLLEGGVKRRETEYVTTYQGRTFRQQLARTERNDAQPWFGELAFIAPHTHGTLASMPEQKYADSPVPGACSYASEGDRSDKPAFVQAFDVPVQTSRDICESSVRTLRSVDDQIGLLLDQLRASGELEHTIVVFTSDNGIMVGAHQMSRKFTAYDQAVRVPLVLKGPGITAGTDSRLVGMIDLKPTLLALTRTRTDPSLPPMDGRSLLDPYSRPAMLLEYDFDKLTSKIPAPIPTWRALVTASGAKYVILLDDQGRTTFREYYAAQDVLEDHNLLRDGVPGNEPDVADLDLRLHRQMACAGTSPRSTVPACT